MRLCSHGAIALLLFPVLVAPAIADDPGAASPWVAPMPPDLGMPQVQVDQAYEPVSQSPSYVAPGNPAPYNPAPYNSPSGTTGCSACNAQQGSYTGVPSSYSQTGTGGQSSISGHSAGCGCGGAAVASSGGRFSRGGHGAGCGCGSRGCGGAAAASSEGRFSRGDHGAGCGCGGRGCGGAAVASSEGRFSRGDHGAGCGCGGRGCGDAAVASSEGRIFGGGHGAGCGCGSRGCGDAAVASSDAYDFNYSDASGLDMYGCSEDDLLDDCEEAFFDECFSPRWTFGLELMFLQRSAAKSFPLLLDGGTEVFNAEDLDFGFQAGPRLSLTRHNIMNSCWDMEFAYFGVDGWDSRASFDNGPYTLQADALGGPAVDTANFRYRSELDSFELNFHRPVNTWLSFITGLRYIELDDEYYAYGDSGVGGAPFNHSIDVDNHLFGGQVGLDAQLWCRDKFRLDGLAKLGLYSNCADQNSLLTHPSYNVLTAYAQDENLAFVGELGFTGIYQVSDRLALRAGYQMMWIEGVALAPEQILATDLGAGTASLDTDGSPFYHGFSGGFEWCW